MRCIWAMRLDGVRFPCRRLRWRLLGILYGQLKTRRFIRDYADHSCHLTDATKKSAPHVVAWNDVMCEKLVYLCRGGVVQFFFFFWAC